MREEVRDFRGLGSRKGRGQRKVHCQSISHGRGEGILKASMKYVAWVGTWERQALGGSHLREGVGHFKAPEVQHMANLQSM